MCGPRRFSSRAVRLRPCMPARSLDWRSSPACGLRRSPPLAPCCRHWCGIRLIPRWRRRLEPSAVVGFLAITALTAPTWRSLPLRSGSALSYSRGMFDTFQCSPAYPRRTDRANRSILAVQRRGDGHRGCGSVRRPDVGLRAGRAAAVLAGVIGACAFRPDPWPQQHGPGRESGRPELSGLISEDPVRRHATAIVEGRRIIGIDPGHGRRAAKTWASLVVTGAHVL